MPHILKTSFTVNLPREEVFQFFANASNLEAITPKELQFSIRTPTPIHMASGTLIEYTLKIFGIPFHWKTLISKWNPPFEFIDEQLKGPYARWVHHHTFTENPDGSTTIADEVSYALPFSPFGELAYPLVKFQVGRIFEYRESAVRNYFAGKLKE